MGKRHDEETINEVLTLYLDGVPKREIARRLFGSDTKESTVRDMIQRRRNSAMEAPVRPSVTKKPKVLIFDIETAPMIGYIWGMWKQNISLDMRIKNSFILCWCAKWLHDTNVVARSVWDEDGITTEDDSSVVKDLVDLINEADFVVAHNGNRFDIPVLKARMLKHGMFPLEPYKSIDTCLIAKKEFRFSSNSLDGVAEFLDCTRKKQTGGFNLWKNVLLSDPSAQERMIEYNIGDVITLEEVYLKLRAWNSQGPNAALYTEQEHPVCPCCGSEKLVQLKNRATTSVSMFPAVQCQDCGKVSRSGKTTKTAEQRKHFLRNVKT